MGTIAEQQLRIMWDAAPVRLTPAERAELVELLGQLMTTVSTNLDRTEESEDVGSNRGKNNR
jgi:hypothetical protein